MFNAAIFYKYLLDLKEWDCREYLADEISFATRENVAIQAADIVAREAMKHLDNTVGPQATPERRSMTALRKTGRFRFDLYLKDYFEDQVKR